MRRRIVTGEEQDVHTGWRQFLTSYQRAGKAKSAKRRTNRRERREGLEDIAEQMRDHLSP